MRSMQKVEQLQSASETTKDAMGQVTIGATDTAEAVQRQLAQTETIGEKVGPLSVRLHRILPSAWRRRFLCWKRKSGYGYPGGRG